MLNAISAGFIPLMVLDGFTIQSLAEYYGKLWKAQGSNKKVIIKDVMVNFVKLDIFIRKWGLTLLRDYRKYLKEQKKKT
ncbi:MAG: hypothetical protein ABIF92_02870 [archaeon]